MAIQTTLAIVLYSRDIRETSKIITFFTRDFGKIKGLAKGIRSNESRVKFSTNFEICSLNNLVYYESENKDTFLIAQADFVEGFEPIRRDIKKSAYAVYFAQLIERANELCDPDEGVFGLLVGCLKALEKQLDAEAVSTVFEIKLLDAAGFLPAGPALERDNGISKGCIRTIEHIRKEPLKNSFRLKVVPKIKGELKDLLIKTIKANISEDLPSLNYLKKMRFI